MEGKEGGELVFVDVNVVRDEFVGVVLCGGVSTFLQREVRESRQRYLREEVRL